jgi:hypothetical protein
MRNVRGLSLALLAVVAFGFLAITGGQAWYLRSAGYRASCEATLSERIGGLPVEIGRILPRPHGALEFQAVRIWLPQRRGEAAFCEQALRTSTPMAENPAGYELLLHGGHSEVSTRTWLREDYRRMLESGLRPGFDPAGPRRVALSGMDLAIERGQFRIVLGDASGMLDFTDPNLGRAALTAPKLNGHRPSKPVELYSEFTPCEGGIRLDRVELDVPELPVGVLGLEALTGLKLHSGSFRGRLTYRELDDHHELTIRGAAQEWSLVECTGGLVPTPWRGSAPQIELEELTLVDGAVERVRFHGVLTGVMLGDVLAPWGLGGVGGELELRVEQAELSADGIERLVLSGQCDRLALESAARAVGWGLLSGSARVVIRDLTVVQNHLRALDAELRVEPAAGELNWIERNLLLEALSRVLGLRLPDWLTGLLAQLPERLEYTQLGVRLEAQDEVLHIFGTHGPREKTILTLRVNGQELAAVLEPESPIDLRGTCEEWRSRLADYLGERWEALTPVDAWHWLTRMKPAATSGPAGDQRPE